MKKIFLILVIVFLCKTAWAIPDIAPATEFYGQGAIKAKPGVVYSVLLSWKGTTSGDYVSLLNSLTSSGTSQAMITIGTGNGSLYIPYSPALYFSTGIYLKTSLTGVGTITADIQYF